MFIKSSRRKNVFSVYITFDSNFKIINKSISKSKIISDERFSYEEAQFIIEKEKNNIPKELTILNKEKKSKETNSRCNCCFK